MILCIIIIIDNNYKTRIVACAIIEDKTLDTYRWIFDSIFTETGISLGVVFSNSDPFLIHLIKDIYPNAQHLLCIFHIDLNLQKKLKGKLGSQFEEFCRKFYVCQNSLCEELFELRWKQLVEQYPVAVKFFSQVDVIIKEFLTPTMLGKQRSQMNQSVCYDISQITDWRHLMEIETDNEEISIRIREQEQDTRQILLRSLVSTIPMEAILEVWNRLVCWHFFCVGTYSRFATFHICMIPNRWYINPDVEPNDLLQQYSFIPAFIYDVKSGLEPENFTDVINPVVIKHKDVSNSNVIEDNNTSNIVEDFTNDTKGQKCSKCKQYGHYAKTCQNVN
ncbi:hypothetical protein RhiirB3_451914 [Rhizophagus irregularis]|nr:hypothetical protein RhiirB3_451914 [Rhizophagus irregularis]